VLNFLSLALIVAGVFVASFGPFVVAGQLQQVSDPTHLPAVPGVKLHKASVLRLVIEV
jgi:hypothetical protein